MPAKSGGPLQSAALEGGHQARSEFFGDVSDIGIQSCRANRVSRMVGRVPVGTSQPLAAWLRHFGACDVDAAEAEGTEALANPGKRPGVVAAMA
jgi:hypothetical protein